VAALALAEPGGKHPVVAAAVDAVSESNIAETMRELESFGTRNTNSEGALKAARWIQDRMASYSPRLKARSDKWRIRQKGGIVRDIDLVNVVAVLPGRAHPDRQVVVAGHYDSMSLASDSMAPGVSDNASGVAAVMELARVMSRYEFDKTLVFIAFSGEEQGLVGSSLHSARAKEARDHIEAVLNNDIIGNDRSGNGVVASHAVRLFSGDPMDSPSRSLARFIHSAAARYVPSMRVDLVFREDRFSRGGDHTPFHADGYAAVRFTTAAENLHLQHTAGDTMEHASPAYAARVARVNAAAMASLGLAPAMPDVGMQPSRDPTRPSAFGPDLSRGKSRYDAVLQWSAPDHDANRTGFSVLVRSTLAPLWEREIPVGDVREFTIPDFSIDDVVLGVKATGPHGLESPAAAYVMVPFRRLDFDATPVAEATESR
jgi:hypothetical protein